MPHSADLMYCTVTLNIYMILCVLHFLIVNSYEVTMLENVHANRKGATLTDAKMKICFQTFGKLLPNRIFKNCFVERLCHMVFDI